MAQNQNSPSKPIADSTSKDQSNSKKDVIPKNIHSLLKNHDLMAVNHLISTYNREFPGIIMNEEKDMDICLQICAFLAALEVPSGILIVTSSSTFVPWHYYLEKYTPFTVDRLNSHSTSYDIQELMDKYKRVAFLLEDHKVMHVKDIDSIEFTVVIAENIERIVSKAFLKRKVNAKFYIGTTYVDFYEEWDQDQILSMMKWAAPDAAIQLKTFFETDNVNFDNFLNNYRFWWYKLTWNFCGSFTKTPAEELERIKRKMDKYKKELKVRYAESYPDLSPPKILRKRRQEKEETAGVDVKNEEDECASGEQVPKKDEYVDVRMDELSIVSSIIRKLEASPEPAKKIIKSPTSASDNNSLLRSFLNATPSSSSVTSPKKEAAEKKDNLSDLMDAADNLLEDD